MELPGKMLKERLFGGKNGVKCPVLIQALFANETCNIWFGNNDFNKINYQV
jgi:hypothetical protein